MSPSLGNGSVPKRSLCFMSEMQGLMLIEAQHSVCVWFLNLHFHFIFSVILLPSTEPGAHESKDTVLPILET